MGCSDDDCEVACEALNACPENQANEALTYMDCADTPTPSESTDMACDCGYLCGVLRDNRLQQACVGKLDAMTGCLAADTDNACRAGACQAERGAYQDCLERN